MANDSMSMVFSYSGDNVRVTIIRCWWQNHYVGDFFTTSQTFHQQIVYNTPQRVANFSRT